MSNVPADLKYAKSHEWLKLAGDGTALVGITDYAQNSLGDITYVQLPKVGAALKAGDTLASSSRSRPPRTFTRRFPVPFWT
jgi:glycine cleavage system H protein